jgi:hypothetical protein
MKDLKNYKIIDKVDNYHFNGYAINNSGILISKKINKSNPNGDWFEVKGHVTKKGYKTFSLSYEKNTEKNFFAHRIVALYFVDGCSDERNIINHIDGNKLNNHYTNLEWCTNSENLKHAWKTGLMNNIVDKRKKQYFETILIKNNLSHSDVIQMYKSYHKGIITINSIAKIYNISLKLVTSIVRHNHFYNIDEWETEV